MSMKPARRSTQKPSSQDVLVQALFDEHYKPLVQFAQSYLSADDAEDVVQTVFAELLTNDPSRRKPVSSYKALLYKGVRYRILDARKATVRERARLGLHLNDAEDRALKALPDRRSDAAELERVIKSALFHMSEREREVHHLHREYGFTVEQMARFLKKPRETIRALLRKGNHILREYLRHAGFSTAGKFKKARKGAPVDVHRFDDPEAWLRHVEKTEQFLKPDSFPHEERQPLLFLAQRVNKARR